jgi:hypothetical protein
LSKTITISEERLQELFELTIAKTKAALNQEAPAAVISNSNVYITNHYGDVYEEDAEPAPQPNVNAATKPSIMRIRPELLRFVVNAETTMQTLEAANPDGFSNDAVATKAALTDRFTHLQHKLKGDTSIESVQEAYIWMFIQLALAAKTSGVFDDGE